MDFEQEFEYAHNYPYGDDEEQSGVGQGRAHHNGWVIARAGG